MPARLLLIPLAVGLVLLWPEPSLAQKEKVFRKVTPEQVEEILKGLEVEFTKSSPPKAANVFWYDYTREGYKVRLGMYDNGATLWVSVNFPRAPLETINNWNIQAKFSRAVLASVGGNETSMVENQLDVAGGVTDRIVRQFLLRFDEEVPRFDKFIAK